ncbi:aspartate aminotransferase family protein [Moorena sp. SIO4A5]|uniref:pyridoxal phosphate-dependent decarboxylase family protein n=1 Tax=Moorena sp. SIO4A5 TaxID=2607838 RepID=UPI0013C6E3FB|nr:aspartate aminotransferase family protein [Moorena sp. SIO4A5]NEO24615.1 aspartate aminotransferase family protein [Moorena sp. SIO4A5]
MKDTETTLTKAFTIILNYLDANLEPDPKVVNYQTANDLKEKLDLTLPDEGVALEALIPIVESYLNYSVRTGSTQFFNLLFSGSSIPGIIADMVTSATNTTMHTYDVAPVATLMEIELIKQLNSLVGFNPGEGLMVTGGSNANLIGMLCGRHQVLPEAKLQGLGNHQLVAFVSEQAHYSYLKAANLLGIGIKNLVKVKSDVDGKMIPEALEAAIQQSLSEEKTPFFVGATAGTTVLGAFDPLPTLAEITRKYGLWLHVDAAWGGPVLFSEKYQHLLAGSELVDSFTWDAHKLMGVPLICSAILVKEKGLLSEACSGGGTDYLFHDDENDFYNLGTKSLQCGRRVDALKLWLCWKYYGKKGYEQLVNHLFDLANYATEYIRRCDNLELIAEPQFLNICFRYIPKDEPLDATGLDQLNLDIRNQLFHTGTAFVNYAHYQGLVMIRLILANPELQKADLETFFHNLLDYGKLCEAVKG